MIPSELFKLNNLRYLNLSNGGFEGQIPPEISHLRRLVTLDLSYNNFTGPLPSFSMSKNLKYLSLFRNRLTGVLSPNHFEVHKNLVSIDLGFNLFSGSLPSSLLNLPYLRELKVPFNQFNGSLDQFIVSPLLEMLDLGNNNFQGTIHVSIFNQTTLRLIQLNSNKFNGTIQLDKIRKLGNLTSLGLSHNNLPVDINFRDVHDLSNFPNMGILMLSSCKLQGIPSFLRNQSKLLHLELADNEIEGSIPHWIWENEYLVHLNLSKNFLTSFEGSFKNLSSNLLLLDLSFNQLQGPFPFIPMLNFGGNKLHGNIPNSVPASCNLKLLDLNDNLLEGTIPKSLANCQKLQVLNLRKNLLTDKFPCFLSNISTLRIMDLRLNKLHGSIGCPRTSGDWKMLHIVDLASNNFNGVIPGALLNNWNAIMRDDANGVPEFGHLFIDLYDHYDPKNFKDLLSSVDKSLLARIAKFFTNVSRSILDQSSTESYNALDISRLQNSITITNKGQQMELVRIQKIFTYLDMSSNNFEGPIPNELMQFKALNALNLSNNALSGHIPSSIGNLKNLESLDLSHNSFNGEIPTKLASLSFLAYLNLSFNHLMGEIPMGTQIQSFDVDSFKGNEELCGPPLIHSCRNYGVTLPETLHSHTESSIDWNILSVELGCIFGFGIFILPFIFSRRWMLWYSKHMDEMLHKIIPQLEFVYEHHEGKTHKTLTWKY
ncbi:unnamed protein product [Sphenostylis stenocarpa]|uniref:Uncharacterized protein n=1 Tax=Sphenostylis stenocarpa TaxID=92480 RepID=A0AA86VAZ6_9FABA|nr:unnamed protein product [Sphenostylis stenocarpa]